jgi:phosphate transport system protein
MSGQDRTLSDTLRDQIGDILDRTELELIRTVSQQSHSTGRELLDRELRGAKEAVLRMGAAVEAAIDDAVKALRTGDIELAQRVMDEDLAINEMQREASSLITTAIATQQPVARDLRFLLALDHVGYELERIGDHARSVAKHVRELAAEPSVELSQNLSDMGELAGRQLHAILQALVDVDEVAARHIAALDDEIDDRYHASFDELLELMRADGRLVSQYTRHLLLSHDLERIGDRVTNIAEDVVFLARGEIEDLNP